MSPPQFFFSVSNQRPDLAIQDLKNIFPDKSSDLRPDFSKTAVILEKQNHHRAHVLIYQNIYVCLLFSYQSIIDFHENSVIFLFQFHFLYSLSLVQERDFLLLFFLDGRINKNNKYLRF